MFPISYPEFTLTTAKGDRWICPAKSDTTTSTNVVSTEGSITDFLPLHCIIGTVRLARDLLHTSDRYIRVHGYCGVVNEFRVYLAFRHGQRSDARGIQTEDKEVCTTDLEACTIHLELIRRPNMSWLVNYETTSVISTH